MRTILFSFLLTLMSQPAFAGKACDSLPVDPSLYWTMGVSPSSLLERSDNSVISDLNSQPDKVFSAELLSSAP